MEIPGLPFEGLNHQAPGVLIGRVKRKLFESAKVSWGTPETSRAKPRPIKLITIGSDLESGGCLNLNEHKDALLS